MCAQDASRLSSGRERIFLLALTALCSWPVVVHAQMSTYPGESYVQVGREFLRTLYPELNGKGYVITLETALPFDDSSRAAKYFMLDVGAGPKFVVLECCIGGYVGGAFPMPQLPLPPELGYAPPTVPSPNSQNVDKPPKYWDAEGRVHPKQYLSTGFNFDDKGRLMGFTAEGPVIGDRDADNRFEAFVQTHPDMTNAEIVAARKKSGAKYGPDDKDEFIKDLPLRNLEPFLGKLELLSVENSFPLVKDGNHVGLWPQWTVQVLAAQRDGTKVKYELTFDHFKGDLLGLRIIPPRAAHP